MRPPKAGEEARAAAIWADALRAAALLAAHPPACGGIVLRAGAGPVRDAWLDALRAGLPAQAPWRRMPAGIGDERLLGGLDLAATLRAGRPVAQAGLLAEADGGLVVVPMAERLSPSTVAKLCAALDTGTVGLERDGLSGTRPARFGLVLLDEGGDDETVPEALADRLAFRIDLSTVGWRDISPSVSAPSSKASFEAAGAVPQVEDGIDPATTLCSVADELGVASLRGPLLAARVARLAAGLDGRASVTEADLMEAARLVLAPRATRLPAEPPQEHPEESQDEAPPEQSEPPPDPTEPPPETEEAELTPQELDAIVLAAAQAAIPPNLLAQLLAGGPRLRAAKAGRVGAAASAPRSGRPAGSRPGDPRRGRLDLIATLRAAAPWQRLRRAQRTTVAAPSHSHPHVEVLRSSLASQEEREGGTSPHRVPRRLVILPDDLRIKRLVQRSETTAIFCVDASGSAAMERLAEAKGAVELLLAESYVRRDRVALVAFRGTGAEVILPPTRSLVRAKRALSSLPGGGGTPIAAGIDAATLLALAVRRGGGSPIVVLLTDGRANVARSGEGGRARAGEEAEAAARALRIHGLPTLLIDTGRRPEGARRLADAAGARYILLPQADAGGMSAAVRAALR